MRILMAILMFSLSVQAQPGSGAGFLITLPDPLPVFEAGLVDLRRRLLALIEPAPAVEHLSAAHRNNQLGQQEPGQSYYEASVNLLIYWGDRAIFIERMNHLLSYLWIQRSYVRLQYEEGQLGQIRIGFRSPQEREQLLVWNQRLFVERGSLDFLIYPRVVSQDFRAHSPYPIYFAFLIHPVIVEEPRFSAEETQRLALTASSYATGMHRRMYMQNRLVNLYSNLSNSAIERDQVRLSVLEAYLWAQHVPQAEMQGILELRMRDNSRFFGFASLYEIIGILERPSQPFVETEMFLGPAGLSQEDAVQRLRRRGFSTLRALQYRSHQHPDEVNLLIEIYGAASQGGFGEIMSMAWDTLVQIAACESTIENQEQVIVAREFVLN